MATLANCPECGEEIEDVDYDIVASPIDFAVGYTTDCPRCRIELIAFSNDGIITVYKAEKLHHGKKPGSMFTFYIEHGNN